MNLEKVQIIDRYMSSNNTGCSEVFAKKVNISRGMLYRYIKYMKEELNAPIEYNRIKSSYQYIEKGRLCIKGWEKQ